MTTTNLGMTKPAVGADSDTWGGELNADLDLIDAFAGKLMPGAEVSVASAAVTDIGAAASTAVAITGTTTITSFGTVANCIRFVRFTGVLTLTHNASSLILLKGGSRATAVGAVGAYRSDNSGSWREIAYFDQDISSTSAARFSTLALGGLPIGSNSIAAVGNVNIGGDYIGANYYAQPAGNGQFISKGFGNTGSFENGGITTNNGNGFVVQCVSNGVILNNGSTSWAAVSERIKKKNLQNIPGDPLAIVNAHEVKLGHYLEDADSSPLRPFLFYEDAVISYPWAARYSAAETLFDATSGKSREVPEFKGLSKEDYVPLLMAAIQKLTQLNAGLEARVAVLESE
jgi:hypothetical protein